MDDDHSNDDNDDDDVDDDASSSVCRLNALNATLPRMPLQCEETAHTATDGLDSCSL